jgi:hypothetical protein
MLDAPAGLLSLHHLKRSGRPVHYEAIGECCVPAILDAALGVFVSACPMRDTLWHNAGIAWQPRSGNV